VEALLNVQGEKTYLLNNITGSIVLAVLVLLVVVLVALVGCMQ